MSAEASGDDVPGGGAIPPSLRAMADEAGPARVVMVDVEEPLPELIADDHYRSAWIVLCRRKVPVHMVIVQLSTSGAQTRAQLEQLVEQVRADGSLAREVDVIADGELAHITVVVPTIATRVEDLALCVRALERLDYPSYDVVLVDNRTSRPAVDTLSALVENRPWLRVITEPRPGISAARNAGVAAAKGEIVAFTDDDVRVDAQWLRAIGARFAREPHVDAVTGLILPAELETPAQVWFERYYGGFGGRRDFLPLHLEMAPDRVALLGRRARVSGGPTAQRISIFAVGAYGAGANMAFRTASLESVGGFNVALGVGTPTRGGEDLAVLINILWRGGQIAYEPAAYVLHRHRREYDELLHQLDGYGMGLTAMLASLIRRDPRHVGSILSQLPAALKWKTNQGIQRSRGTSVGSAPHVETVSLYPSNLFMHELIAFARGPLAYFRSVRAWRRVNSPRAN